MRTVWSAPPEKTKSAVVSPKAPPAAAAAAVVAGDSSAHSKPAHDTRSQGKKAGTASTVVPICVRYLAHELDATEQTCKMKSCTFAHVNLDEMTKTEVQEKILATHVVDAVKEKLKKAVVQAAAKLFKSAGSS